jgi:hypothetical protein
LSEELTALFDGRPVKVKALVGLEGLTSRMYKAARRAAKYPDRWQRWLETHYRTCTHPAVVGLSEHILIIVRKEENIT